MNLLEFLPQCCDSQDYLMLGTACAQDFGQCYDKLRPMGSALWFSLPYRLGLPPESLIGANIFLALLSVVLSSLVFAQLTARCDHYSPMTKWLIRLLLGGCNLFVHAVVFSPVIFNSISDAPAALFSLLAIWLLLLNEINRSDSSLMLGISGMLFGFSAWIRAFYLYPVLATFGVFGLCWIKKRNRSYRELILLVAMIPIGLQFSATYIRYRYLSYINREDVNEWSQKHLEDQHQGYDTLLPPQGYYWSANCAIGGAGNSVRNSICLIAQKFVFYFGSYAPRTYLEAISQRRWSNGLLILNVSAMFGTGYFFIKRREILRTAGVIAIVYSGCILGEGLLIIPEQRFMLFVQIIAALVFLETVIYIALHKKHP